MPLPAIALGATFASFLSVVARFLIPYLLIKLFLALGITTFSIVGTIYLVDYIEGVVTSQFSSLPANVGAIAIRAGMLDAFAIIFNCWVIAVNIRTLRSAYKGFRIL